MFGLEVALAVCEAQLVYSRFLHDNLKNYPVLVMGDAATTIRCSYCGRPNNRPARYSCDGCGSPRI